MRFVIPEPNSGCWLWAGSMSHGYGKYCTMTDRKRVVASRWIFEKIHGRLEPRMFVCHSCDTPSCVNPQHLFKGTAKDNMADAAKKGRTSRTGAKNPYRGGANTPHNKGTTHCPRGHEYTPENTYRYKAGGRACRECRRAASVLVELRRKQFGRSRKSNAEYLGGTNE